LRAAEFDIDNIHSLVNTVPEYLKIVDSNDTVTISALSGAATASVDDIININKS